MKPRNCSSKIRNHSTIWYGCAAAICGLSFQSSATAGTTTAPAPAVEPTPPVNWVNFVVGGAFVSGDDSGMMRRTQMKDDFYGGIESFGYIQALNKSTTLTLGGHALPGLEDYEFTMDLTKTDLGYIKGGYREFRTWYDGSGGVVPGVDASHVPLYDSDELSVDRGEVWFEAGLRMENLPEITFNYNHSWRDGTKDSTSWGGIASGAGGFKTIPALTHLDEQVDTFRLDFTHTLGSTDLGGGLSYQHVSNQDTRVMKNGTPTTTPATGQTVRDTSIYDSDIFNSHLFSETRFGERLLLSFGYSFTNLDTDIGGDRPSNSNATGALLTSMDHALFAIQGGAQSTIHVLNANLWWNPINDLVVVPSIRAEFENQYSMSHHIAGVRSNPNATLDELTDAINGVRPLPYAKKGSSNVPTLSSDTDHNGEDFQEFVESLEVRYSGVSNVLFYGKAEFTQAESDIWRTASIEERDVTTYPTVPGTVTDYGTRAVDSEMERQKYVLGVNWYMMPGLSLNTQAYASNLEQNYDNVFTGEEDAQLSQHNNETTDANIRLSWRAMPNLTFVTRYDYQQSEIENQAYYSGTLTTDLIESADITKHILTESVTWSPLDRLYIQGSIHWISAETETPQTNGPNAVREDLIANCDNDYWSASVNAGYAIDDKTDITASYSYYGASNYAAYSGAMEYGLDTEEHAFSVTLTRILTPNMVWNLSYGFVTSQTDGDDQSGGFNDFTAQMVSTGLKVRF